MIIQKVSLYDKTKKFSFVEIKSIAKKEGLCMYFFENHGNSVAVIGGPNLDDSGEFISKTEEESKIIWDRFNFGKMMSYKDVLISKFTLYCVIR